MANQAIARPGRARMPRDRFPGPTPTQGTARDDRRSQGEIGPFGRLRPLGPDPIRPRHGAIDPDLPGQIDTSAENQTFA